MRDVIVDQLFVVFEEEMNKMKSHGTATHGVNLVLEDERIVIIY